MATAQFITQFTQKQPTGSIIGSSNLNLQPEEMSLSSLAGNEVSKNQGPLFSVLVIVYPKLANCLSTVRPEVGSIILIPRLSTQRLGAEPRAHTEAVELLNLSGVPMLSHSSGKGRISASASIPVNRPFTTITFVDTGCKSISCPE